MKLQSLGIGNDRIVMMFDDGKTEKLEKCPLLSCGLYHSTEMAICPITGMSIDEEVGRQKEESRRIALAREVRKEYKKKHLPEWRGTWLQFGVIILVAVTAILALVIFKKEQVIMSIVGAICLLLMFPWMFWEEWRRKRIEKKADVLFQQALEGRLAEE